MQGSPVLLGMARIRAERGLIFRIARALGISRNAVGKWKRVPAERVLAIEAFTGISRHDLRPDLYPRPYAVNVNEKLSSASQKGVSLSTSFVA